MKRAIEVGKMLITAAKEVASIARGENGPARTYAIDPAPDVCEWITEAIDPMGYGWMISACGHSDHERNLICQKPPIKCPSCGKRIQFTESQQ